MNSAAVLFLQQNLARKAFGRRAGVSTNIVQFTPATQISIEGNFENTPREEGSACQSRISVIAKATSAPTKPVRQRFVPLGRTNVWPGRATEALRRSSPLLNFLRKPKLGGTPAPHTGDSNPKGTGNKIARSIPIAILQSIVLTLLCPVALFAASPRIACETATFDFGTRDSSEIVEHIFELKNTGDSDLVITAIRPACGCTAAELTNSTIPPGESAKLATKLTLAGRSGDVHKTILIESNDPANPAFQLAMQGKIVTEVAVVPPVLTLRQSAPSQPASGAVQIVSTGKAFRITQAEPSDPAVQLRTDPMPDGVSHQISASLEKIPETDPQPFLIMLQTDNPRVPTIDIPATVVLMKKILVAPERIVVRKGDAGSKKYVVLKSADGMPLEIKDILTPNPAVKVDYSANPSSIRLTVRGLHDQGEFDGKAISVIFTNGESIQIPVVFESQ